MKTEEQPLVKINNELCIRCLRCAAVCPNRVFTWDGKTLDINFQGRCIECGHCAAVCPEDAFEHIKYPKDKFEIVTDEYPITPDELQSVFARRRSCRCFSDEPVNQAQLNALLDAAAAAPTATNSRNVRFMVLDTKSQIEGLAKETSKYYLKLERQMKNPIVRFVIGLTVGKRVVNAYKFHLPAIAEKFRACLKGDESIFYKAPLVLIAYASGLAHIVDANCNLAAMQIMHKAEAMKLGTCYNGYALTALVREKKAGQALGIPEGCMPGAVLAVGHPLYKFKKAPKRRRPRAVASNS